MPVAPTQILQTLLEIAQRTLAMPGATSPYVPPSPITSVFPVIQPEDGGQSQASQAIDASGIAPQQNGFSEPHRWSHDTADGEAELTASRGSVTSNGHPAPSKRRRVSHDARSPSASRGYTGIDVDEPLPEARQQRSSSTPEEASQSSSTKPPHTLFVKPDDQPMTFSIDMGVRNRIPLLNCIKVCLACLQKTEDPYAV